MWNNNADNFGGGGFVNSPGGGAGAFGSPANQGEKRKSKRSENIIPVSIKQLNDCQDDNLTIVDVEANVISIVGLIKSVDHTTTKISCHIDDQTGVIEAINYVGTDGEASPDIPHLPIENTYGRVVGALRSMKGSKYVVIFKYFPVTDMNEVTCHMLEVIQVPLKLKRLKEAEAQKTGVGMQGGGMNNTLANSMMANNIGGPTGTGGGGGAGNLAGFKPNQQIVLSVIQSCNSETGLHIDEIVRNLKNRLDRKEIKDIIDELSNEGHIFSTVDDDHFKHTL